MLRRDCRNNHTNLNHHGIMTKFLRSLFMTILIDQLTKIKKRFLFQTCLFIFGIIFSTFAFCDESSTRTWLKQNDLFFISKTVKNISPDDGLPGSIIAARSRSNPNYYYHWVRDAGLTV